MIIKTFLTRIVLLLFASVLLSGLSGVGLADISDVTGGASEETSLSGFWSTGFSNLSELTDEFSKELFQEIPAKKIYLDRTSIRDIATNDPSNFSSYLQHELESSLSERNFFLVYDLSEADYLIGATYQRHGKKVKVFFKYHKADGSGRKSRDYEIEISKLPKDSFKETIKNKAYKLAANIMSDQTSLRVYIKPIVEGNDRYVTDFSNLFTSRVKSEIIRFHRDVEVIDKKPIFEKLSNTRGIKKKATKVKNLKTSDAFFVDANAVLEGQYFVVGEIVTVNLFLRDLSGKVLNSSTVDIEKTLIKASLENKEAKMLADLADVSSEKGASKVKISTTKGGEYPVYYRGEKIKFHIQVAGPLYVYIYDINSKGDVSLLYPHEKNNTQQKLMPGRLYTIPSETDNFELEVESPFGMDAVKVFACIMELPIPELTRSIATKSYRGNKRALVNTKKAIQKELSCMESINPKDLVDYYKGVVGRFDVKLYEDSLMLETRDGKLVQG
jgi:hypothetical protein